MNNLYIRFLIVAVGSSALAWIIIKYLISKYHSKSNVSIFDLLACVIGASSTCGFIGIVLVDGTQYAKSAIFYWGIPIIFGFIFGVAACHQLVLSPDND
ncbi:MAG: hypothetical protein IPP36_09885 [Nitrosomonadales bacterium]|nr:hypothetical protein [Nitrosomonadales bacterium]